MTLKEKITKTLQDTHVANIDKMLRYMEQNGYFTCHSSSHNHWKGGASQHMWAVYLIAKALRDQRLDEPTVAKYATDKKLTIVCLLHDLGDMDVRVYDEDHKKVIKHEDKSYWIMKKLGVGTKAEQMVVRNHMHGDRTINLHVQEEIDEYNALHTLITMADRWASGTAWNSTRFKESRTQHHGVSTNDIGYLRAVAMDRSVQSGNYHLYMDEKYELREYRNYNVNHIKQVCREKVTHVVSIAQHIPFDSIKDVISSTHEFTKKSGQRLCLVVGVKSSVPVDKDTRLRHGNKSEQDILICSNILAAFYHGEKSRQKESRRYRYEFTMRDNVKQIYQECAGKNHCLYLPGVTMIRDGESRGFPFVEPWIVDILLVLGDQFDTFAVPAEIVSDLC